ncbi:MAG: NADP-dependent oxidoreductase [Phycisphaerales bacterium]|nr:NADP-dependent oxidoreductase [Phycisphaerales bacterium]
MSATNKTRAILLASRPQGDASLSNFTFTEEQIPALKQGEIQLKALYVSVDPYLRGRMNEGKSYIEPFELQKPVASGMLTVVVDSKNAKFKNGDVVFAILPWKEIQNIDGEDINLVSLPVSADAKDLSIYLGVLGLTGLTAYFGFLKLAKPKSGETVVVSGAAGAVGSVVGQLAKMMGCKVVGIVGSDQKVELVKSHFGFDAAFNYKTTKDFSAAIKKHCPQGVDIYFDNVGGDISDAVLDNINKFARIIICGAISIYNATTLPLSAQRIPRILLVNSATMQGFLAWDFNQDFPIAVQEMSQWLKEGKLKYKETIVNGFENIPQAFLNLFKGTNEGKMIVKL